ncbi:type I-U CRISPR-associated protein Csx17 [bacterium]|nr:type I-U CRISPR-associated protein Csx17 [bacterium]
MNVHRLEGCAPTPLAHYLKALGILRVVAEQADAEARGCWHQERFSLATRLDRKALLAFFLFRYSPTPLVSPWNKGSGFYYENDPPLMAIEGTTAARFDALRTGVAAARAPLATIEAADGLIRAIKNETKRKELSRVERESIRKKPEYKKRLAEAERRFKELKADLIPNLREAWRGPHREWLDAALVLDDDGTARFPALLGTGGNDGRLDFTNNYFQRIGEVFDLSDPDGRPRPDAGEWFQQALFGDTLRALCTGLPVGQFAPGGAGGANMSTGPVGGSLLNPVDVLLTFEGAVLFTASLTRRIDAHQSGRAAAPFALAAQGAGYASAADGDESARGEQWMPLWRRMIRLADLRHLLTEGRAQIGARAVSEPLDLARAAARLGIARGVVAFQRFGYIERNGQSNLAVPLGRISVSDRIAPRLACLDDLDAWLPRIRRAARAKGAPSRLMLAERRLADALFALTQHADEPLRWQMVLLCLADIEAVQVSGSGFVAGPIPRLRPEWIAAADDTSPELRLGVACALQAGGFTRDGRAIDPVRRHWLPLERGRFRVAGSGVQARLRIDSDVVLRGRSGLDDAIALVERRLIEAAQRGQRRVPLVAARCAAASAGDLTELLAGRVDVNRALALARALMAIDARRWAVAPVPPRRPPDPRNMPDDAWLAIRLALLPWSLAGSPEIGADPAIVRRLSSGDAAAALDVALRRLHAAGVGATVRTGAVSADIARRWCAALAFPITVATATAFVRRLAPPNPKEASA